MLQTLESLPPEELGRCKKCGKKFWIYWHVKVKDRIPTMEYCAPCYFKNKK